MKVTRTYMLKSAGGRNVIAYVNLDKALLEASIRNLKCVVIITTEIPLN